VELDRHGKVPVQPDLSLSGHDEVFVIGDLAHCNDKDGKPLPGLAPVAMQQGRYAARRIVDKIAGRTTKPFRYFDKGNLATIGRSSAVGVIGRYALKGTIAWLAWLFIHLMYLVEYDNRLLVLTQWIWNYVTWGRGVRLITHLRRDKSGVAEIAVKFDKKDNSHDNGDRDA
jgi:NADH dehydrogenase